MPIPWRWQKTISSLDGGLITNYYSDREPSSFRSSASLPAKIKSKVRIDTGLDRVEVTGFDGLDRIIQITTQDNQVVTVNYSGYQETVTDQVSMQRLVNTDALGRISSAVEPNLSTNTFTSPETTTYTYDVLDNLAGVSQGTQSRSFVYNKLGGLTLSKWPGTYDFGATPLGIYWSYDNAGRQQTAKWATTAEARAGRPTRNWSTTPPSPTPRPIPLRPKR